MSPSSERAVGDSRRSPRSRSGRTISYRNRLSGLLEYRPRRGFRASRQPDQAELAAQLRDLPQTIAELNEQDELSSRHRLAAEIDQLFLNLDISGRSHFLESLAEVLFAAASAPEGAAVPPPASPVAEQVIFRLSAVSGGFAVLAEMNASLSTPPPAAESAQSSQSSTDLSALRRAIRHRLAQVCTADFLELRSVDWDAPAAFLEQLSRFERVHPISSMDDLRDRLDEDRRCFALFHPALDDQPVAIVWCALLERVPRSIGEILNLGAETGELATANTAAFYSIANTHPGLAGLGLGNELILSAVEAVSNEFPQISTFVTLSPIPSFRGELNRRLEANPGLAEDLGFPRPADEVVRLLADPVWMRSFEAETFKEAGLRAAARYLRELDADPVANFHLSNGALLDAVHWAADLSDLGIADGAGMMVNYRYDPARLATRRATYRGERRVPISTGIKSLSE